MIATTFLLLAQLLEPTASATPSTQLGFGAWRLGMSKEEVRAVSEFGPYSEVSSTGGLETRNGLFTGKKTTVSFVFGERGLRIIQVWAYEGQDFDQALNAFHRVYQHLEGSRGAVQVPGLKVPEHADSQTFGGILRRALSAVSPDTPFKVQMAPVSASPGINVFASFMKQPQIGYYYVFLYYRIP